MLEPRVDALEGRVDKLEVAVSQTRKLKSKHGVKRVMNARRKKKRKGGKKNGKKNGKKKTGGTP